MRLIALGLIASLTIAAPVSAQATNPAPTGLKEAKPEKPKKVCRAVQVTGQRIPKRECKTEADWAGDAARDGTEVLRIRSVGSVVG